MKSRTKINNLPAIIDVINRIMALALKLNSESDADIFVDYSAHIRQLSLRLYNDGWHADRSGTWVRKVDIYLEGASAAADLMDTLTALKKLAKEKGVNIEL